VSGQVDIRQFAKGLGDGVRRGGERGRARVDIGSGEAARSTAHWGASRGRAA